MKANKPITNFNYLPKPFDKLDFLGLFERDPFGNSLLVKRLVISILGSILWSRFAVVNKVEIEGMEQLEELPEHEVIFLSNHQTYFADVITFYFIFCAVKWGYKNTIVPPLFFLAPRARIYFVAASETMKEGLLPRIFSLGGAITINRSWRANGENVSRSLDTSAGDRVAQALQHGWVVSFPQGTTKPYAPIRKGTAHMIKDINPIVVPVVINGYRRAFDKKGLRFKKPNTTLSVKFKTPRRFEAHLSIEEITTQVRDLIEQNPPVEQE
jgi:1-acyl-sn-glycerol-3-phosphate acyltransferase